MKTYYNLINQLEQNLVTLENQNSDIRYKSEQGIKLIKATLHQIMPLVIDKTFETPELEIEFFKIIKPQIFSKLIFYVKRFNIESKRPRGSNKEQAKYLNGHIKKLQNFFNNNLEFYNYYKVGATYLDHQYFIRDQMDIRLNIEAYHFFTDKQFSTSHDSTVSTVLAHDALIIYLKDEINKLITTNTMETIINPFHQDSELHWTGRYVEIVELAYALYATGKINNGNIDIKSVVLAVQKMFNIDNDNYYNTFTEVRSRKINPTKFIDLLKDSLQKYIDNLDDLNKK